MKTPKTIASALMIAGSLVAAGAASAQSREGDGQHDARGRVDETGPAPSWVEVRRIAHAGTGCPAGSAFLDVPVSGRALFLIWDAMIAEAGPGVPFVERRKNCAATIDLAYPSGWQYAVESIETAGFVSLDRGVTATAKSSFYFAGQSATGSAQTTLHGPTHRGFFAKTRLGSGELQWSPCATRRALTLNTQVYVTNTGASSWASGFVALGDEQAGTLIQLKWRRC